MIDLTSIQALRDAGEHEQAREQLLSLAAQHPTNAQVQYMTACVHDMLGYERAAVPFYHQAIENGLRGEDLRNAYLGLGSTYRALGQYTDARQTLEQATALFQDARDIQVFLAMTLYNLREHTKAMQTLLHIIADTSDDHHVRSYSRAIHFYADQLDTTWDDS